MRLTSRLCVLAVDTKNRDGSMDKPGMPFSPGPYPQSVIHNTQAPRTGPDAVYSGILECPCTDRITTQMGTTGAASARVEGACTHEVSSASECESAASKLAQAVALPRKPVAGCHFGAHPGTFLAGLAAGAPDFPTLAAAQAWCCSHPGCGGVTYQASAYTARAGATPTKNSLKGLSSWLLGGVSTPFNFTDGSSSTEPTGCSMSVTADGVSGFFNSAPRATAPCGGKAGARRVAGAGSGGNTSMSLTMGEAANQVTIVLSGPSGVWFGAGFNANSMSGTYAVVVDGQGKVSEHKLGQHAPGTVLQPTVKVIDLGLLRLCIIDGSRLIKHTSNPHHNATPPFS